MNICLVALDHVSNAPIRFDFQWTTDLTPSSSYNTELILQNKNKDVRWLRSGQILYTMGIFF